LLEFGPKPSNLIPLTHLEPLEAVRSSSDLVGNPHLLADAPGRGFGPQRPLVISG
jgi:hypothetical protein